MSVEPYLTTEMYTIPMPNLDVSVSASCASRPDYLHIPLISLAHTPFIYEPFNKVNLQGSVKLDKLGIPLPSHKRVHISVVSSSAAWLLGGPTSLPRVLRTYFPRIIRTSLPRFLRTSLPRVLRTILTEFSSNSQPHQQDPRQA